MLRLQRKQQKATARLSNFINKQTREDSKADSFRTNEYGPKETPLNFLKNEQTREDSKADSFRTNEYGPEETPLNFLKNEQLNAVNATNNEENIQQNTSKESQKDVLVDSFFLHKIISDALKTNHKTLLDNENFSFTKNLSISYLHPNSAYPQNFGWLNSDLEADIINEPCLTKFYVPYIINNLIKLTACDLGAV